MDPITLFLFGLIVAALRGPGEAGRAVRGSYRSRNARWQGRAEARRGSPGAGRGRRSAGGILGWPDRAARSVRPSAIRTGITVAAALATGLFAISVAFQGFRRGAEAGWRAGRAKARNRRGGGPASAEPGDPTAPAGPDDEVVDAELVDPPAPPEPGSRRVAGPDTDPDAVWDAVASDWADERAPAAALGPAGSHVVVVESGEDVTVIVTGRTAPPRPAGADVDPTRPLWVLTFRDRRDEVVNPWTGTSVPVLVYYADDFTRIFDALRGIPDTTVQVTERGPHSAPLGDLPVDVSVEVPEPGTSGWLLRVHGPGINPWNGLVFGSDSDEAAVFDREDLHRRLAAVAATEGVTAEVFPYNGFDPADLPTDSDDESDADDGYPDGWWAPRLPPDLNSVIAPPRPPGPGIDPDFPGWRLEYRDRHRRVVNPWTGEAGQIPVYYRDDLDRLLASFGGIPGTTVTVAPHHIAIAPFIPNQGGPSMASSPATRANGAATRGGNGAGLITPAVIPMPALIHDSNYHAHLHNLEVLAQEAIFEMQAAQLAATAANTARQRAGNAVAAIEQIVVGLTTQDFGQEHVARMFALQEQLQHQAQLAAASEAAAYAAIESAAQVAVGAQAAAEAFRRDHQLLAEAHAASPYAARTREAYQPQ
jgi:hypothetical protein